MRKIWKKIISVVAVCCLAISAFAGCDTSWIPTTPEDSGEPQIREIYEQYAAYAAQKGQTVLSYEEWLVSIRGEAGRGIVSVEIVEDKLVITYTDNTTDRLPLPVAQACKHPHITAEEIQGANGGQNRTVRNVCDDCSAEWIVVEKSDGDGHVWATLASEAATCQKEGYVLSKCSVCGEEKRTALPVKLHNYNGAGIITDGSYVYTHSELKAIFGEALTGLTLLNGFKPTTCTKNGKAAFSCPDCTFSYLIDICGDHTWSGDSCTACGEQK